MVETYSSSIVVPFGIGMTVFVTELVQQFKSRYVDIDRLAGYCIRQQGTSLQQKEATQQMAREIANILATYSNCFGSFQPQTRFGPRN